MTLYNRFSLIASGFVLVAILLCTGSYAQAAESAEPVSDYRLSSKVKPLFQEISLRLDPDKPTFSGTTKIDVDVTDSVEHIGFYQSGLEIEKAELVDGDVRMPLKVVEAKHDIQIATVVDDSNQGSAIAPKRYVLEISYKGKINTTSDGVYLSAVEGRNYLYTQFQDMHARKAFPSFDEPGNKIAYQVTIESPEKHVVLSNTPVLEKTVKAGQQRVVFKKTKPMPSYLVAFAVGEMDFTEIKGLSVPGRIYTPKGQSTKTKFAVKHTPRILAALEKYFGSDYPYEKLDFLAVANFTHGAMENVGLVTYRSGLLLLDDEPKLSEQGRPLSVIAHELAHMWYGNLVTMAWWDDLWLNEAFASWMASKIMNDLYPEQNYHMGLVAEGAFGSDANPTTRPVKKPVRTQADVMDGLGLNYSKGEAILELVESLVGKAKFQKAVRAYMKQHAWGNAKADDLWENLSAVADFDVPAMMQTYLEQSSYPLIDIDNDGVFKQRRYARIGVDVTDQTWIVPLEIKYKKNGKIDTTRVFLNQQTSQFKELTNADWVFPNADARGYYRWQIPVKQLQALLADLDQLNGREKKSLLFNYQALLSADKVSFIDYMTLLERLSEDEDQAVARAVVGSLSSLEYLVEADKEERFGSFLDKKLLRWFEQLGTQEAENDLTETIRLRTSVFSLLSKYSNDPRVSKASQEIARQYLKDTQSSSRRIASSALKAVSKSSVADGPGVNAAKWFDELVTAYKATSDTNVHSVLRSAMRFSTDAEIEKTLNFALEGVSPANIISVIATASANKDKQDLLYTWLEKNSAAALAKMPDYHVANFPRYVSSTCDRHNISLADKFYKEHAAKYEGMQRGVDIARSNSEQCVGLKTKYQKPFDDYLSKR